MQRERGQARLKYNWSLLSRQKKKKLETAVELVKRREGGGAEDGGVKG